MATWVIRHFRHKFRPKQLLPTPLAPMLKYLFQNQHFCIPFVMFVSSFSLASPWMMALYSSLALIKPELSLSASFPCASNNSFPNNRAIAACFDVFRIAVKEPRAFTSSVVNTKPSTCPWGQKWESIHQEQSKTSKLLTETVNLDQGTTSKTQKTFNPWHLAPQTYRVNLISYGSYEM